MRWARQAAGDGHPGRGNERANGGARRPRRRWRQAGLTGLGVALLWGALGFAGYAAGWQAHQRAARSALVGRERSVIRHEDAAPVKSCAVSPPATGQLAGLLRVPALGLTAPVEQGTGDAQLAVAVGHDVSSVWPGNSGTAVFLAHDVSYFVHLNELRPGDRVIYQTACDTATYTVTGSQVVQQGSPVANSPGPTLVLDTCYPPNALFFTADRLLVSAQEDAQEDTPPSRGQGRTAGELQVPNGDQPDYQVPAPPSLVAQGLTLQQNEVPMGTMTLQGQTSASWQQSPGPLDLEAAALEAYFGGLKASAQEDPAWWTAIAEPSVLPPSALLGAQVTGAESPLDVAITSSRDVPEQVVLSTSIAVAGGQAPGAYDETVTEAVQGNTVRIAGWSMSPA